MSLSIRHSFDENGQRIGKDPARTERLKVCKARRSRERDASNPEPLMVSVPDYTPSKDFRSEGSAPFSESAFLDLAHVDKLGTIRSARKLAKLIKRKRYARESASLCVSDIKRERLREAYLLNLRERVNALARARMLAKAYLARFERNGKL
jgi:hypothetical protein